MASSSSGWVGALGGQRVGVRDQVAAHPVHVDELQHRRLLLEHRVAARGRRTDGLVSRPRRSGSWGTWRLDERRLVEVVLRRPAARRRDRGTRRLGALDDPVVVGAGHRHDLGQAERRQRLRVGLLELRREADRAGGQDQALPRHQPRHRVGGAEHAGVGQRDVDVGEVVGDELAGLGAAQHLVVGREEPCEVHQLGVLDARHDEAAAAVLAPHVDGETEVDVGRHPAVGDAADLQEHGAHRRVRLERLDQRPGDQVGEADLASGGLGEVLVQERAVLLEQLDRDGAHRRGGGHGQRRLHVVDQAPRRTDDRLGALRHDRGCSSGRGGRWRHRGYGRHRGRRDDPPGGGTEVREELAPRRRQPFRLVAEHPVHFVDQPRVRSEVAVLGGVLAHVSSYPRWQRCEPLFIPSTGTALRCRGAMETNPCHPERPSGCGGSGSLLRETLRDLRFGSAPHVSALTQSSRPTFSYINQVDPMGLNIRPEYDFR